MTALHVKGGSAGAHLAFKPNLHFHRGHWSFLPSPPRGCDLGLDLAVYCAISMKLAISVIRSTALRRSRPASEDGETRLGLTPVALAAWPGRERREPPRSDRHYLALSSLVQALRNATTRELAGRRDLAVLDIGCGRKPYLPLFAGYASRYVGFDFAPAPEVDDTGSAEALPYPDASFDVVLCTQMLEHAEDPDQVVREIHRVLAPGGVVFASTHGVFLYHPIAQIDRDYWRWTHSGLRRLCETSAPWTAIEVEPNGDVVACLGYITAQFLDEGLERMRLVRGRRLVMAAMNRGAEWADRRFPFRGRVPAGGSLSANCLVTARRSCGSSSLATPSPDAAMASCRPSSHCGPLTGEHARSCPRGVPQGVAVAGIGGHEAHRGGEPWRSPGGNHKHGVRADLAVRRDVGCDGRDAERDGLGQWEAIALVV